jgi:hypothetical protein
MDNSSETKKPKFVIVTANSIIDTGKISFKFIFDSKLDYVKQREISEGRWGHLIDLPGCAHAEPSVTINVFDNKPSSGICFGWGDATVNDAWLIKLVQELPSCTLLMKEEYAKMFTATCDVLSIEYLFHHFDGELLTA